MRGKGKNAAVKFYFIFFDVVVVVHLDKKGN